MRNMTSGLVLSVIFASILLWVIPNGIEAVGEADNIALSASFWPTVTIVCMLMLSLLLVAQGLASVWTMQSTDVDKDSIAQRKRKLSDYSGVMLVVVLLIPYYYLSEYSGLLIASVLAFVAYSWLAGERKYLTVIIWSILVPVILTLFFTVAAQVLIPLGPLAPLFR